MSAEGFSTLDIDMNVSSVQNASKSMQQAGLEGPPMNLEVMESCASMLKVLGDETRLTVVRQLLDGPRYVHELNEAMGVEQSLLSHHLKVLREAHIVEAHRDGKAVLYRLSPDVESRRRGKVIDLGCCRLSFE
jgi:DNA-binding transcriptional ArsR family regulator